MESHRNIAIKSISVGYIMISLFLNVRSGEKKELCRTTGKIPPLSVLNYKLKI